MHISHSCFLKVICRILLEFYLKWVKYTSRTANKICWRGGNCQIGTCPEKLYPRGYRSREEPFINYNLYVKMTQFYGRGFLTRKQQVWQKSKVYTLAIKLLSLCAWNPIDLFPKNRIYTEVASVPVFTT